MKNIYILIILLFFAFNVQAQPFSLDTTFNVNYTFNYVGISGTVYGLNYELDGKLMIYGSFWDGISNVSDILRIYEDGSLDNTWQFMGTGASTSFDFVKYLNNVYIVRNSSSISLCKYNYNGQVTDTAWFYNTYRGNICHWFYLPYFFSDGSMLVGTDSICNIVSDKKRWFMRFLPDGNVDTNFKHAANGTIFGIVKYSSDKLLVYGGGMRGFSKYDTIPAIRLCRIDTVGNMDTTFKSIFTDGTPYPSYVQNDGKIIICGGFRIKNNPNVQCLIRLNADGSLDSTFNNFNSVVYNPNAPNGVYNVCYASDGGYLVGGQFRQYQGYTRNNIAKTDANGFIDTTYFNGMSIDSVFGHNGGTPYVYNIVKGINDNYYVMGNFLYYNGVKVNPIIRIHGLSVGINEVKKEKEMVKVFPNPATTQATISYPSIENQGQLQIYNMLGQLVYEASLNKNTTQIIVDTRIIKKGIYFYEIKTENEQLGNGKIVINN